MADLNEVHHRVGHRNVFAVEANDEASGHEHTGAVDLVDAVSQISPSVLFLFGVDKRLWIGAFDADEDREEIRVPHQNQQFVVVGHVDRGLG